MRALLTPAAFCVLAVAALSSCATLDNSPDGWAMRLESPTAASETGTLERATSTRPTAVKAHGPAVRGPDGWVVSVTPQELAALGFGQQMELDVQARDVVYVVDYQRISQLDGVFARTAGGLLPLRTLLKKQHEAGRVVLRTRKAAAPASQPAEPECG